jgi:trehalose 6-phosphate synthase/phosphatase
MDWSKSTAAEVILEGLKKNMIPDEAHKAPMDFLMVVGDGREDEVIFRWANDLGNSGYVKHVTTVSLGSRNTEAMNTLTQGVTGQFISSSLKERFANQSTGVLTVLQKLAVLS